MELYYLIQMRLSMSFSQVLFVCAIAFAKILSINCIIKTKHLCSLDLRGFSNAKTLTFINLILAKPFSLLFTYFIENSSIFWVEYYPMKIYISWVFPISYRSFNGIYLLFRSKWWCGHRQSFLSIINFVPFKIHYSKYSLYLAVNFLLRSKHKKPHHY